MDPGTPLNTLLIACYLISALGCAAATFGLALVIRRTTGASWFFWLLGAGPVLAVQGITRIPAIFIFQSLPPVQRLLAESSLFFWSYMVVLALTAGLCEEGGRWAAWRWIIPRGERSWRNALMLGAGHGGIEAVAVGVLQLLALVNYLALRNASPEALGTDEATVQAVMGQFTQLAGWEPLLGLWERCATLLVHVALSVMVLQAFRRHWSWWFLAVVAHAGLNFGAILLLRSLAGPLGTNTAGVLTEIAISACALAALGLIFALRDPPPVTVEVLEEG